MSSDLPDDALGDLEAITARLPKPPIEEVLEVLAARRQGVPTPTTVPAPEVLRGGIVRYRRPLSCPWYHEERPGLEPPGPLLPAGYTSEGIAAAITSAAQVRGSNHRLRVERAVADHFTARHPER